MVLTVSFVLSPAIRICFVTVASGIASANLTPTSRRQDHTTSPSASASPVSRAAASTASRPYVRDVRETPLWVGRDVEGYRFDLGQPRSGIFLREGLDRKIARQPVGQITRHARPDRDAIAALSVNPGGEAVIE
jgi:hypothetical protein